MKIDLFGIPPRPLTTLFDGAVRLLALTLVLGAIVLSGWWLTQLSAPRPVAKLEAPTATQSNVTMPAMLRLFGSIPASAQDMNGLRLTGVYVNQHGRGFATFQTRNGATSASPGEEVAPGIRLERIDSDRVVLTSHDAQSELRLHEEVMPSTQAPVAFPR